MLKAIQDYVKYGKFLFSKHARDEMETEEFGEIKEKEVSEAVLSGKIIESYPEDEPYPSCLIYGRTSESRPLHIVCAYGKDDGIVIIITVYQPDPGKWIDFERRKI
ncbi:MAG TPA: DUF4258 domain-containing protein [Nitrospirae bacterium]|nr:DUF4258 domain-containing protein [Nitrospirota bacterium]